MEILSFPKKKQQSSPTQGKVDFDTRLGIKKYVPKDKALSLDYLREHPAGQYPDLYTLEEERTEYNRCVTTAFVNFVVDQLQAETSLFGDFKYHDSGTGGTAENATDTGMETATGIARAPGTQTEGASANIYRSVGTITYNDTFAIVEHGLFNASSSGTLMDRTVFSAINVVSGNQIEFTYEITFTAGS